jgi:hypothetical protein
MSVTFGPTINHFVNNTPLGSSLSVGGFLICKNLGVALVVAPSSSEVRRTFCHIGDAITMAACCTITPASSWFVPSMNNLSTWYSCRQYSDSYQTGNYWSSSGDPNNYVCSLNMSNGSGCQNLVSFCDNYYVRAFRCITY